MCSHFIKHCPNSQQELLKTVEAGGKLVRAMGDGTNSTLSGIDEAVGQIHSVYVSLPSDAPELLSVKPRWYQSGACCCSRDESRTCQIDGEGLACAGKSNEKNGNLLSSSTDHFQKITKRPSGEYINNTNC